VASTQYDPVGTGIWKDLLKDNQRAKKTILFALTRTGTSSNKEHINKYTNGLLENEIYKLM